MDDHTQRITFLLFIKMVDERTRSPYDRMPINPPELGRRIDHIFVRCSAHGPTLDVRACERIFDEPVDGTWGSDHFGFRADLSA
jgi:endonuclease/exonuclease/phosphatase family metal-dependent hydrolase